MYLLQDRWSDVPHKADVACGTSTDAMQHLGHVARPRMAHAKCKLCIGDADTWEKATRVHGGPRERPWGVRHGKGADEWKAHKLAGPC